MKLTTFLIFIVFLHVSAASLAQKITYDSEKASLSQLFNQIQKQTGYDILVSSYKVKKDDVQEVHFKNTPLRDVLDKILSRQQLVYEINDKTILIKVKPALTANADAAVAYATVQVSGKVTDSTDKPLYGASIKIKGNTVATTGAGGGFVFSAQPGDEAMVTFIGYSPYIIHVDSHPVFQNIILNLSAGKLAEVIVNTGYQSFSRERSAGSFARPDMKIFEDRTGTMNVLQRLDGLIPGLAINNSPTATANPLLIRGLTSVNGTRAPLTVIDGMEVDNGTINTINPNDVEDVTVLKDATAASIWGSRASNGVIVITTKKGKANQKLKINYNAFINFQGKPDQSYYNQLSGKQFIDAAKAVFNPTLYPYDQVSNPTIFDAIQSLPPHETILYNESRGLITPAEANSELAQLANTNNQSQVSNLLYRNAYLMNHTLSLQGGSGIYGFYGSMAYTRTMDNRPGDNNNSYKINLRQDFNLNKHIKVYLITDLTNTLSSAKNPFTPGANFLPYALLKDKSNKPADLSWLYMPDPLKATYEAQSGINLDYVPLNDYNDGATKENDFSARVTSGLTIKLIDGLNFEGLYGLVKSFGKSTVDDSQDSYYSRTLLANFTIPASDPGGSPTYYLPTTGSVHNLTQNNQQNYTVRNQLTYNKSWNNDKHQLSLLAGQEIQDQLSNSVNNLLYGYNGNLLTSALIDYQSLYTNGINNPVIPNNFGASYLTNQPYTETETELRFESYYANAAYTFDQKYTLNTSWRIDHSNLFGKDRSAQDKPVYSFGGAWVMSNEPFMTQVQWVQHLALRATYGITGNSPIPGSAASYDIASPGFGGPFNETNSLIIRTPANRKLTWESTQTYNLGLDFTLAKSRISGSIDVYKKDTKNLIGLLPVNTLTGYSLITGNFGDINNKGVELSLASVNIRTSDFSWNTMFTMGYNKNMVSKLDRTTPISDGDTKVVQNYLAGFPAFAIFAYRYAGLDNMGDPQIRLADGTVTKTPNAAQPGDIKYMGTFQPVWTGGFSNMFRYNRFGLDMNMVYSLGSVMRRDVNTFYTNRLVTNVNEEFANRWQKTGDEANTNVPSYEPNHSVSDSRRNLQYYTLADINVVSASYIKMRDVTLSYSLPKPFLKSLNIDNVTFKAQVSNFMLWKANKYGIDPEFQQATGTDASGQLNGLSTNGLISGERTLPVNQKTITLGVNATF